jgi:hypothetical protein
MGPMLVVMPRVLGQDLPEVSFTVDQQVAGALGRSVPTYRSAMECDDAVDCARSR